MPDERRLVATLVELAGAGIGDVDAVGLLEVLTERIVHLLGVAGAGIIVADQGRTLHVVASTSDRVRLLELFQLQHHEGPSLDCYRSEAPLHEAFIAGSSSWPAFAAEARAAGFRSVHALPMRWRTSVIGALDIFRTQLGPLSGDDVVAAQALADVATIGILQQRTLREATMTRDQLQWALNSRVLIEQAKGLVAGRAGVTIDEALFLLRAYARKHNRRLHEIAELLLDGTVPSGTSRRGSVRTLRPDTAHRTRQSCVDALLSGGRLGL